MIKQTPVFISVITAAFISIQVSAQSVSQPVTLSADKTAIQTGRQPQFENAEAKVWKSIIAPGKPLPLHRHDHPRVLIALTGGTMNIVEDNGKTETHQWETGKAYWLPANLPGTLHTDENVGDKPIEVMVVELKNAH